MMRCRLYSGGMAAVVCAATLVVAARADVAEEVRALIDAGEYENAVGVVEAELAAHPKSQSAGVLNALAGEAHYELGNREKASGYLEKARARGVADAYRYSGRLAMEDYDFAAAADMYSRYVALKEKASKPVDAEALAEKAAVELASGMLERVENIVVFDRIDVDHDDFFTHYALTSESGALLHVADVAGDYSGSGMAEAELPVFQNQRADFRLWAQPDTTDGVLRIMESNRFTGGEWEQPSASDSVLNGGGNAAFPFMMTDGTTLYFASDGDGSIGGYDIFRSNRDPETASYQAPVNMGMPYNSPGNDYMLAIDESAGIGWWATDRNNLPDGKISIYLFVPNDIRRNYDVDTPGIRSLARLDSIEATQVDADPVQLENLRTAIRQDANADGVVRRPNQFDFPVAAGTVYHNIADFRSPKAAELMEQWLEQRRQLDDMSGELATLRRRYATLRGDAGLTRHILDLEKRCEAARTGINRLRGKIVKAEKQMVNN